MTNEERQQAIEWMKRRPVMMAGAKRMYDLAVEALEAYVPDINVGDMISRQVAIDALDCINGVEDVLRSLPSAEPTITLEQAIDYLHKTGWLQNHDRILTESKMVPPVQTEIIHCKDCKYTSDNDYCHCKYVTWWNNPDDYCSRAERKGKADEQK